MSQVTEKHQTLINNLRKAVKAHRFNEFVYRLEDFGYPPYCLYSWLEISGNRIDIGTTEKLKSDLDELEKLKLIKKISTKEEGSNEDLYDISIHYKLNYFSIRYVFWRLGIGLIRLYPKGCYSVLPALKLFLSNQKSMLKKTGTSKKSIAVHPNRAFNSNHHKIIHQEIKNGTYNTLTVQEKPNRDIVFIIQDLGSNIEKLFNHEEYECFCIIRAEHISKLKCITKPNKYVLDEIKKEFYGKSSLEIKHFLSENNIPFEVYCHTS